MPTRPLPFDPIAEAEANWRSAGWDSSATGMVLTTSITRVQAILQRRVDKVLLRYGLTFARFEVLMLLVFSRNGQLPLGKIGQRLQVHPASVTNAIDRLECDGLVRRVAHPDDGRTTLAAITPKGRRTAKRAATSLNAEVFTQTGLTDTSIRRIVEPLAKIRSASGDFTTAESIQAEL